MTKDDVLNTPAGRELDELVDLIVFDNHWYHYKAIAGNYVNCKLSGKADPMFIPGKVSRAKISDKTPKYSVDIVSVWELVNKMNDEGHGVYLTLNSGIYGCSIIDDNKEFDNNHRLVLISQSTADTISLAICRAVLLAKLELQ